MPNNRELAALIGLAVFVVLVLSIPGSRRALPTLLRTAAQPVIVVPLVSFVGYCAALVGLAAKLGLWDSRLLTETIFWTAGQGLALLFGVATGGPTSFSDRLRRALKATVVIEAFIGLFALGLGVELLLLVAIMILGLMSAVAESRPELQRAKAVIDVVLSLFGIGLFLYAAVRLAVSWDTIDKAYLGEALALPIYLTIGLVPFLYGIALWVGYDRVFRAINHAGEDRRTRWRVKLGVALVFRGRVRRVRMLTWFQGTELANARTVSEARSLAREAFAGQLEQEKQGAEKRERLDRYAGVEGVDDDCRRLDQREFDATRQALQSLFTAQIGWHDQDGRYRNDLVELFAPFSDLPDDHGLHLDVSSDGQSWWAWRRTVSGWCFAIGAARDPREQWLFDGSDPPSGPPGSDPSWGEPFGLNAENW